MAVRIDSGLIVVRIETEGESFHVLLNLAEPGTAA